MAELNTGDFIPYDSPDYERDEHGNIKIYNPEPEPNRCKITGNICGTDTWAVGQPCKCENCQKAEPTFWYSYNGYYPSEPLLNELTKIKNLLKQILNKL